MARFALSDVVAATCRPGVEKSGTAHDGNLSKSLAERLLPVASLLQPGFARSDHFGAVTFSRNEAVQRFRPMSQAVDPESSSPGCGRIWTARRCAVRDWIGPQCHCRTPDPGRTIRFAHRSASTYWSALVEPRMLLIPVTSRTRGGRHQPFVNHADFIGQQERILTPSRLAGRSSRYRPSGPARTV